MKILLALLGSLLVFAAFNRLVVLAKRIEGLPRLAELDPLGRGVFLLGFATFFMGMGLTVFAATFFSSDLFTVGDAESRMILIQFTSTLASLTCYAGIGLLFLGTAGVLWSPSRR